jgi:hypothetical protein
MPQTVSLGSRSAGGDRRPLRLLSNKSAVVKSLEARHSLTLIGLAFSNQ